MELKQRKMRTRLYRLACLFALALPFAAVSAPTDDPLPGSAPAPLDPGSPISPFSLDDDLLAHDPGFNSGAYFRDSFAGAEGHRNVGWKIARFGNGDVVAAGLVAHVGAPANSVGRSLGLVRYNSAGQRVAWSAPGVYGHYNNEYVMDPKTIAGWYTKVIDIVVSETAQDRIYVLVDSSPNGLIPRATISVWTHAGRYITSTNAFPNLSEHSYGAGLVYYRQGLGSDYKLAVIGTRFEGGKGRIIYRRMKADDALTDETGVRNVHSAGVGECSTTIQTGGCIATAVTSLQWTAFEWLPPRIYVTGLVTHNSDPEGGDMFVTRLIGGDSTSVGYADGTFGSGGTRRVWFNAGGTNRDYPTAVAATRGAGAVNNNDEVYIVGHVAQRCTYGIGVAAFNHDGTPATFGTGGKLRFGGQDAANCSSFVRESADLAHTMIYDADRLVIAGMSVYEPFLCIPGQVCEDNVDPMLAIVRARDGLIQEHRDFPIQPGGRTHHGAFYGIARSGTGTYTLTGDARFPANHPASPGGQQYLTARFRLDRIFGNGLDCDTAYPFPPRPGCPN